MTTLYEDLGVNRDASEADIRAAYRRKAKKSHPDTGGDRAEFERQSKAVAVLTDPEKRKRYDETGQIDDGADNREAFVFQMLDGLLAEALSTVKDPVTADFAAMMRENMAERLDKCRQGIDMQAALIKQLEKVQGRFKQKTGSNNQIERLIADRVTKCRQSLADGEKVLAQLQEVADILAGYEYRYDAPAPKWQPFAPAGFGTFTTWPR